MHIQAGRRLALAVAFVLCATTAMAAQYASLVMDARDGTVLYARNADTKLHPASLTKMMTLYLVFDAVERGELSLDQKIKISSYAASKPPSKLGLRAGSSIELRYLIRAASVKSANDAAAALAEAVSGSEPAFARKMTATARAMGMNSTTFKNASGLTQSGHLSTARDMALLGRRLFFDFPEYYNLFSRISTSAKVKTVYNTNRRLLRSYQGADGIKTGYTSAAGFNLVSSARRGNRRVIVSMFGGTSSAQRNAKVAELMDLGFNRMPARKATVKPGPFTVPSGGGGLLVARAKVPLSTAPRPMPRPGVSADLVYAAVSRSLSEPELAEAQIDKLEIDQRVVAAVDTGNIDRPALRPQRFNPVRMAVATEAPRVTRVSSDNTGSWAVQLGGKHNRSNGERLLLRTALQEMEALEGSVREMKPTGEPGWYRARFTGLSEDAARTACARLAARQMACEVMAEG